MVHGRSQDRPINLVSKRRNQIYEEKESLSQFVEKKYDMEQTKQKLEQEIKQQQMNIELLKQLKEEQDKYQMQQEKIKINQNTIQEYQKKIEELAYPKSNTVKESKDKQAIIPFILPVVFMIVSIVSVGFIKSDILSAITIVLSIISILYVSYTQYQRRVKICDKKQIQSVDKEKVKTQIQLIQDTVETLQQQQENQIRKAQMEYKKGIEKIRSDYLGIIPIQVSDELLSKKQAKLEIEVANNKIGENKLKIQSIGLDKNNIMPKLENLANLEEELINLEEEYKELTFQNEAIELAKKELENAYYQMKKKVTPKFTSKLSQIMGKISQGRYTNIQLDETEGMIVEIENGDYMPIEYLSIGTIEQLYLALRLSAGDGITKEGLPIMLDETFAYYDDERLNHILQFLYDEYKNRQILIFTCTNREKNILDEKNIPYHFISL